MGIKLNGNLIKVQKNTEDYTLFILTKFMNTIYLDISKSELFELIKYLEGVTNEL